MSGPGNGEGDRSGQVPGMLSVDTERSEDGVRRGHPCCTVPQAKTAAQKGVRGTVSGRDGIQLRRVNCLPVCCRVKNDNEHGALLASARLVHSTRNNYGRLFI